MSNLRDRSTFETAYSDKAPWDIGKPQGAIAESVDLVISPVLDAGCGMPDSNLPALIEELYALGLLPLPDKKVE